AGHEVEAPPQVEAAHVRFDERHLGEPSPRHPQHLGVAVESLDSITRGEVLEMAARAARNVEQCGGTGMNPLHHATEARGLPCIVLLRVPDIEPLGTVRVELLGPAHVRRLPAMVHGVSVFPKYGKGIGNRQVTTNLDYRSQPVHDGYRPYGPHVLS